MSVRDLVETECGGSNSLVQLSSHFINDRAFADEGVDHPFQQFGEQNINDTFPEGSTEHNFKMESLLNRMRHLETPSSVSSSSKIVENPGLFQEASTSNAVCENQSSFSFPRKNETQESISAYANQYLAHDSQFQELSQNDEMRIWDVGNQDLYSGWLHEYQDDQAQQFVDMEKYEFLQHNRDIIWENDFNEIGAAMHQRDTSLQKVAAEVVQSMEENPEFENSEFLEKLRQLSKDEIVNHTADREASISKVQENMDQFSRWADDGIVHEGNTKRISDETVMMDPKQEEQTKIEGSSSDMNEEESEPVSSTLWSNLSKKWEELNSSYEDPWYSSADPHLASCHEYNFAEQNPMRDKIDALKEGKKRLHAGDLAGAILCFEGAVQQDKNNVEAWLLLGKTQAENEQDQKSIAALKKCLQIDKENLEALMTIAVCYTNENYQYQACFALKEWLKHNRKYSYIVRNYEMSDTEKPKIEISSILTESFFKSVLELYTKALFQQSYDGIVDADIQNGLGVLYTLSNDHERAAEYFTAAVREKPDDARLWNRLGATLANGQKTEQAIEAYRSALTLSPGFIRARYNLGITCIHLEHYTEAIENLLSALNLQSSGRGIQGEKTRAMSESIWSTLRLAVGLSDKRHLLPFVLNRNLTRLNDEFHTTES